MDEEDNQEDVFDDEATKALAAIINQSQSNDDDDDFDFEKESDHQKRNEATDLKPENKTRKSSVEMLPILHVSGKPPVATTPGTETSSSDKEPFLSAMSTGSWSTSSSIAANTKKTNRSIIVYGPPGSTKNFLVRRLVAESPDLFTRVTSHTTRQPLAGEVDGREYYFINAGEFQTLVESDELIEHTVIRHEKLTDAGRNKYCRASVESLDKLIVEDENLYGMSFRALSEAQAVGSACVVLVLDMDGAKLWKDNPPDADMEITFVFIRNVRTVCYPLDQFHSKIILDDPDKAFNDLKAVALSAVKNEQPLSNRQLLTAQAEWNAVETVQPGMAGCLTPIKRSKLVTFAEVLAYFQSADLQTQMENIQPTEHHGGISALKHALFGPPKLHQSLRKERDLIFAIALFGFDNSQVLHNRILQTIYRKLTGTNFDCGRFGSHWQLVGFQGTDPVTDLRGTGFLGLVHLLYLLMDSKTYSLAAEIYKLSQDEVQNFPFCALSINITRIALQSLREGCLSKECNGRGEVINVVNEFYVSVFLHLYLSWYGIFGLNAIQNNCVAFLTVMPLLTIGNTNIRQSLRLVLF